MTQTDGLPWSRKTLSLNNAIARRVARRCAALSIAFVLLAEPLSLHAAAAPASPPAASDSAGGGLSLGSLTGKLLGDCLFVSPFAGINLYKSLGKFANRSVDPNYGLELSCFNQPGEHGTAFGLGVGYERFGPSGSFLAGTSRNTPISVNLPVDGYYGGLYLDLPYLHHVAKLFHITPEDDPHTESGHSTSWWFLQPYLFVEGGSYSLTSDAFVSASGLQGVTPNPRMPNDGSLKPSGSALGFHVGGGVSFPFCFDIGSIGNIFGCAGRSEASAPSAPLWLNLEAGYRFLQIHSSFAGAASAPGQQPLSFPQDAVPGTLDFGGPVFLVSLTYRLGATLTAGDPSSEQTGPNLVVLPPPLPLERKTVEPDPQLATKEKLPEPPELVTDQGDPCDAILAYRRQFSIEDQTTLKITETSEESKAEVSNRLKRYYSYLADPGADPRHDQDFNRIVVFQSGKLASRACDAATATRLRLRYGMPILDFREAIQRDERYRVHGVKPTPDSVDEGKFKDIPDCAAAVCQRWHFGARLVYFLIPRADHGDFQEEDATLVEYDGF